MDETLITAIISGGIATSGIIFTQWRADGREQRRVAREDASRSYDHRRDAYLAFLRETEERTDSISKHEIYIDAVGGDPEPPEDFLVPLYRLLLEIRVYGTRAACDRAQELFDKVHAFAFGSAQGVPTWQEVEATRDAYVEQIRRDLHVTDE